MRKIGLYLKISMLTLFWVLVAVLWFFHSTVYVVGVCSSIEPEVFEVNEPFSGPLSFYEPPATVTILDVIEITPADANGKAIVKWLDPNNTEIDEPAKQFFEVFLKDLCDDYIREHCKKEPCEHGACKFCGGTGCDLSQAVLCDEDMDEK